MTFKTAKLTANWLELTGKVLWFLVLGAFGIGAWVTGIQLSLHAQGDKIEKVEAGIREEGKYKLQLIDVLGRIDERLKNIERHSKQGG